MEYEYWFPDMPAPATLPESVEYYSNYSSGWHKDWVTNIEDWVKYAEDPRRWPKSEQPAKVVYLAWYHSGFTDDPPELLGVYSSPLAAHAKLEDHKVNGDCVLEFEDQSKWWVKEEEVK